MTVVFVGTVNWSKLISSLNNSTARPPPRCLPGDLAAFPRGDPATWLVAGTTTAGVVATTILRLSCHCLQRGLQIHRWRAMEWLSKSVYVSEQACIGWCRTGAYYIQIFTVPSKVLFWIKWRKINCLEFISILNCRLYIMLTS